MADENNVLLVMDKDNRMCSVSRDGITFIPVNSENLDYVESYSPETMDEVIRKYVANIKPGQEALIFKIPKPDIVKFVPDNVENVPVALFEPRWLSEHVMDLSGYIPKREISQQQMVRHALDERKINKLQILQEWGLNLDTLRDTGDLDRMLNYGRSRLMICYPIIAGVCFPMQTKLTLRERNDGSVVLVPHPIRREPNLIEYLGYRFTDEDRVRLVESGNLGHTIMIDSKEYGKKTEVYVSLDKETKELVSISKRAIRIPSMIKGVQLTEKERKSLENGEAIVVKGLKSTEGKTYDALLQVNAERRTIVFKSPNQEINKEFKIGNTLLGKNITDEIRKQWESGLWVYMEDLIGKNGKRFSSYVRPNFEKGRFDFSKSISEIEKETGQSIQFLKALREERKNKKNIEDENGNPQMGTLSHAADSKLEADAKKRKLHL